MRAHAWLLCALALGAARPAAAFDWPNATERVEKQLAAGDVATRRRGAQRLGDLPEGVTRRLVLRALADPDSEVRLAAAQVALERRIRGAGAEAFTWLNDPERQIRLAAAEILRVDPLPKAVPVLGRVLGDPDPTVRSAAAAALAASSSPDAVLPLLGHLDDSTPAVRSSVVRALAKLRDARAVLPLIGKIQDSRANVRRAVARALGELRDPRASSALILALRDSDDTVRVAALEALGMLRDKGATLSITAAIGDDPRSGVRAAALGALARIGTPEALDTLVAQLGIDDPLDAEAPARLALGRAAEKAVPRLEQCLAGQPARRLADGCALALAQIGSKKAAPVVVDALRRGVVTPSAALSALAKAADARALPTVLEQLGAADPSVRRNAIDAAAALLDPRRPDGRAVDPIAEALDRARSNRAERAALARLLGRSGSPRAVRALVPMAEAADDVSLRIAAIEALGSIAPAGQDRALLAALGAEEAPVRLAAAVALRRAASGASARALLDRLERSAEQDRAALAIALAGALGRSRDGRLLERTERSMRASRGGHRDALIEAIGRFAAPAAAERLSAFAERAAEVADRAKVAEALAGRRDALTALRKLSQDVDGSVRANAIWSLGSVAGAGERALLVAALDDRDVAVAGNAAAALGRVALRTRVPATRELCGRLADPRGPVRASALAALSVAGARCPNGEDTAALQEDRSAAVRAAAARLLARVPGNDPAKEAALLETCAGEDPDGAVAASCAERPDAPSRGTESVAVYVVPPGEAAPVARAPFALVRADGLTRLGLADRRGQVFEHDAPVGAVSLDVPAPLAR